MTDEDLKNGHDLFKIPDLGNADVPDTLGNRKLTLLILLKSLPIQTGHPFLKNKKAHAMYSFMELAHTF